MAVSGGHPERVLLGMKKRGFGIGKWNGFGGKVSNEKSTEEVLLRELKEEALIEVESPVKIGILEFEFPHNISKNFTIVKFCLINNFIVYFINDYRI